jgi:hypothetical protein
MDWTAAIDIYCERTSAGFWAEPLNAWSNLAFPAAALWAGLAARRSGGATAEYWLLVVLAALVGVGSFLFHTFANVWSDYADTIPIWMFVAATAFVAMRRIAGLRLGPLAVLGLAVVVAIIVAYVAPSDPQSQSLPGDDPLNGSGQYAPALIALGSITAVAWWRRSPARRPLLGATGLFVGALAFRSIDLRICAQLPTGTHFLWHLLLGVMVGMILTTLRTTGDRSLTERQKLWPSANRTAR